MSAPPPSEESLHWKRDESIDLPKPESEGRLAIRRQDWKRLKTRIQRTDDSWSLSIVYSVLFGFAGSVGPSIIPIAATKDLPAWVTPLYVCLFVFSLLTAFVFLVVDKKLKTKTRSEKQEVIEEMIEIEGMFIRRKGLQNPVDVSTTEPIKNPATSNQEIGDQE